MPDYFNEKQKLSHRLVGLSRSTGEDILENLEQAHERVSGKILKLLDKAEQTESLIRRKQWLEKQRAEIEKIMTEVYQEIGETIKDKSVEIGLEGSSIANTILKKSVPKEISIKLSEPHLDKKRVLSWFESSQVDGLYFGEYLKKLEQSASERIIQATRLSMTSGEGIRELTKTLRKSLDIGRNSAQGFAQTSFFSAYNFSEYEYFLENEDIIKWVQWSAELDRRTCSECAELDQQTWPLKEVPFLCPIHFR
jgi:hypothetical protein